MGDPITVSFTFFDRKFGDQHTCLWECEMRHIPRIGDEVLIPGDCLYHDTDWMATNAKVDDVTWSLADDDTSSDHVMIYCEIMWDER